MLSCCHLHIRIVAVSSTYRMDESGVIKVSDFGLAEDMYCTNYFRNNTRETESEKLPIKWMAPECIETNTFNERSDVVSFQFTNTTIKTVKYRYNFSFNVVVIWSDLLGGVHLWWSAICWSSNYYSAA